MHALLAAISPTTLLLLVVTVFAFGCVLWLARAARARGDTEHLRRELAREGATLLEARPVFPLPTGSARAYAVAYVDAAGTRQVRGGLVTFDGEVRWEALPAADGAARAVSAEPEPAAVDEGPVLPGPLAIGESWRTTDGAHEGEQGEGDEPLPPVEALLEELRSGDPARCARAVVLLGRHGEGARPALEAAQSDPDPDVRVDVERALRALDDVA